MYLSSSMTVSGSYSQAGPGNATRSFSGVITQTGRAVRGYVWSGTVPGVRINGDACSVLVTITSDCTWGVGAGAITLWSGEWSQYVYSDSFPVTQGTLHGVMSVSGGWTVSVSV